MADLRNLASEPRHLIVICGGAVAGSEAALACAERGITALVIEQNARPYGKIEDGLPRWHERLRAQECARIDQNLKTAGVYYVPCTRLGRDVYLDTLRHEWRVSAAFLATGAWHDRRLPVPGIDAYVDRGLVYQNPFVYWFNHYHERGYAGPQYDIVDDAIVIGGGLASIDVAKIVNLELYARALAARGIHISVVELERRGIPSALAKHGLQPEALGVRGCTLYYRRRKQDMPVASPPDDATPAQRAKIEQLRVKLVDNVMRKYLVHFEPCHIPVAGVAEGDRLVGLRWRRTEVESGQLREIEGSDYEVRSDLIISSIGSIPVPMPGVRQQGELYDFASTETGALTDLNGVFGLGNVLTGKGNIKDSRMNARDVSARIVAGYLGLGDAGHADVQALSEAAHAAAREAVEPAIDAALAHARPLPCAQLQAITQRIEHRWQTVGYTGDYDAWIAQSWPQD